MTCKDCVRFSNCFKDNPDQKFFANGIESICTTFQEKKADVVNHPSHYESGQFECIDVMLETQGKEAVMDFCLCNAFKYLYRHNRKNGIEDIKKSQWYINKYIELSERE